MNDPVAATRAYYGQKLRQFGARPEGVDWNGEASQHARFACLGALYAKAASFSLNDLGCGYGALYAYLRAQGHEPDFHGYDLVPQMITEARARHPDASWSVSERCLREADFTVASGIFNVRNEVDLHTWQDHVWRTVDHMNDVSRKGFAFNCLTAFSNPEKMRAHLFYADPGAFLNRCLERYSRSVTVLHGVGLYEFTLICDLGGLCTVSREPSASCKG